MSQDPKTNPPPNSPSKESLEDLVYRSDLASGNRAVKGASPMVTIPMTFLAYGLCGVAAFFMATHTDMGKKVIKGTTGIDLTEQDDQAPPPPPPPPPAPPAPAAPAPRIQVRDAPPPPPITSNDTVPEVAPRELPKEDLTMRYAQAQQSTSTGPGFGVSGQPTGPVTTGPAQGGTHNIVDFDFNNIRIKFQPPAPVYPALAKIAKIQGTVIVEIVVGPDGVPVSARAVEGPPQLRRTAEEYAMGWKFEPAMLNGVAQTARFKLTMPFRLK